jgi:uncharacterized RDD family membrane protein YckC
MGWYYFKDDEKIGPISKEQIDILIQNGIITSETKIWNDKTQSWKLFEEVADDIEEIEDTPTVFTEEVNREEIEDKSKSIASILCDGCGLNFPDDVMIEVGDKKLCKNCKQDYLKGIREGLNFSKVLPYGSFFVRFVAKIIDGIIIGLGYILISFFFSLLIDPLVSGTGNLITSVLVNLLAAGFGMAYQIYFIGNYNATIGKMVLGLEIIIPDGTTIDYRIATYRVLAEGLSSIGMGFGYFMAAFDEEKRTLHDRICNTRVVFR